MIQVFALVAGFSTAVFTVGAEKPNSRAYHRG
jgi:hypothetical protein